MAKITAEQKIEINNLYLKYKTYAEVGRQMGISPATVKRYVIANYTPIEEIKTIKFTGNIKPIEEIVFPLDKKSFKASLSLTEEELKDLEELRKEAVL